jgi:hypothetical protein
MKARKRTCGTSTGKSVVTDDEAIVARENSPEMSHVCIFIEN